MNLHMNRKVKIAVLTTMVAAALLAVFWTTANWRLHPWFERLDWERWVLTDEQRTEIEQLVEAMREEGATWKEIRDAINANLDEWGIKRPPPGDIELFYTMKTAISSINAALLVFLVITYVDLYKETHSEFTVGLIVFAMVLLLYALSSNPLVQQIFGFSAFGLGPFAMLPDLFTFIALIVLLYLTFK